MKVAKPYHLPGSEVKNTISAETNDRVGESETEEAAILKRRNRENESNKEEQQQQALRVDKKAIEDKVNSLLADVEGNDRGKKKAYGLIMPGEQSLKTEVEPPIEKKKKVGPALPPTLKKEDLDLSKVLEDFPAVLSCITIQCLRCIIINAFHMCNCVFTNAY